MNILVGILTGATASMGLGGGFILLVYLSVFTEIPQDIAQGINLLFFLPIALLSLVIHIKNKLTDLKLVGKYLILGLPVPLSEAMSQELLMWLFCESCSGYSFYISG